MGEEFQSLYYVPQYKCRKWGFLIPERIERIQKDPIARGNPGCPSRRQTMKRGLGIDKKCQKKTPRVEKHERDIGSVGKLIKDNRNLSQPGAPWISRPKNTVFSSPKYVFLLIVHHESFEYSKEMREHYQRGEKSIGPRREEI